MDEPAAEEPSDIESSVPDVPIVEKPWSFFSSFFSRREPIQPSTTTMHGRHSYQRQETAILKWRWGYNLECYIRVVSSACSRYLRCYFSRNLADDYIQRHFLCTRNGLRTSFRHWAVTEALNFMTLHPWQRSMRVKEVCRRGKVTMLCLVSLSAKPWKPWMLCIDRPPRDVMKKWWKSGLRNAQRYMLYMPNRHL